MKLSIVIVNYNVEHFLEQCLHSVYTALQDIDGEVWDISFSASHLADLIKMTDAKEINSTVAKEVFEKIFFEDVDPKAYVEEKGLKTENNEDLLLEVAKRVIEANPQSVTDYKSGKEKAIGFLVGQSMRELKGKADPVAVTEMLKKLMS